MGFPSSSDGKKICLQCRRAHLGSWVGKIPWRRDRLPTPVFLGFPGGSAGRESACNAGGLGWEDSRWRRAWQPTPVFLPGEAPWTESLVGCSPWSHKGLDTTEPLNTAQHMAHARPIRTDIGLYQSEYRRSLTNQNRLDSQNWGRELCLRESLLDTC